MSTACAWDNPQRTIPAKVLASLEASDGESLHDLHLLLAIPEYKVDLPGGARPSQTDVFALCRNDRGLVAMAVEGKADETFGPTVGEKLEKATGGQLLRLKYLHQQLGLDYPVPEAIRYQLLHRTVSALLLAETYDARAAVMMVHSFSEEHRWFEDYARFVSLFSVETALDRTCFLFTSESGIKVYTGWASDEHRSMEPINKDVKESVDIAQSDRRMLPGSGTSNVL